MNEPVLDQLIQWYLKLWTMDLGDIPQGTRWQSPFYWSLIASIYFSMKEYANEGKPSDGEIYRKIRNYRSQKQSSLEMRWWTLLSVHRVKNLKQLFRHRGFILVFDAFLKIPALLTEMRINILYKIFALKCDEINVPSLIIWMRSSIVKKSYIIFNTLSRGGSCSPYAIPAVPILN